MYDLQRWHHSPERLYQECWMRFVLREQVDPASCPEVCNIGVGMGEFDDFLGYWLLEHGQLTSVDIDEAQVRNLAARQREQGHPNASKVVHADLMRATLGPFDLVTVAGTTLHETHAPARALQCALAWVKPGGLLFATVIHDLGDPERILSGIDGVVLRETFSDLPGGELTTLLARTRAA